MIAGVADTHAVIWYLYDDPRLSKAAGDFMDRAAEQANHIGVSPITLVEAIYLIERGRIPGETLPVIVSALQQPDSVFVQVPFDLDVAQALQQVSRADIPDMPDRIIAATALHLSVPVISRDGRIQASSIQTIW
jgi:PIN domain nuclease of toxin-antitoxin system